MNRALSFVPAAEKHAELFSTIHAQAWKEAYLGIVPEFYLDQINPAKYHKQFLDSLDTTINFIIFSSEIPIGILSMRTFTNISCPSGEIIAVYLLENYKGLGYGRKTLYFTIDYFHDLHIETIFLWVLSENQKARHFYEYLGFIRTDETRIIDRGKPFTQLMYRYRMPSDEK